MVEQEGSTYACHVCHRALPQTRVFFPSYRETRRVRVPHDCIRPICRECGNRQRREHAYKECMGSDCHMRAFRHGLCVAHNRERISGLQEGCSVQGCQRAYSACGLCSHHYQKKLKYGDPLVSRKKQGSGLTPDGYRVVRGEKGHPNTAKNGRIAQHRQVMIMMLGRPLLPGENVHHKNGIRTDNRPENLELWITSQPCGKHIMDLLDWAKEVVNLYSSLTSNPYFRNRISNKRQGVSGTDERQLNLEGVLI